ncbi:hypothetical protein BAUCODRAFT_36539 [Baudoinia panamericana UAMH 10762]|uniref:Mitochondrial carrier n=1 Tax=Baudoinia panamericana (strain UAMH 10762) TaxID=717646 RepID=M2LIR2_BAUPA|nr:uncharacterized protein BAUCODRAFT_36539 [Baudoinia panamericana UAMH 10762]EMC94067.1 hypothetical protein BAUCODRAFT_36539 [Baudoinia panamericana UAMH 10762]
MSGKEDIAYAAQADAFTIYHHIQELPEPTTSSYAGGPALPALGHAVAGALASGGVRLVLYPLELVTTRLQVQRQLRAPSEAPSAAQDADAEYRSPLDAVRKIYKHEGGFSAFYTGCAPDLVKGVADSFLFFLAYTFLRQRQLKKDGTKDLSVVKELAVGIAAGSLAKLFTTPIQNVVTRKQTAALVAAREPTSTASPAESDKLSVRAIASQIYDERGITGFWRGYSASTILTLNPAITFAVDNLLKQLLPPSKRDKPPPALRFLLAALSKAVATTLTYPVILAKSRAQAVSHSSIAEAEGTEETPSDDRKGRLRNLTHRALHLLSAQYRLLLAVRTIYRNEGVTGLYSGLEAEVLKGFLSHGLTMTIKDRVHIGVIQLYYMVLQLRGQWTQRVQEARSLATNAKARAEKAGEVVMEKGEDVQRNIHQLAAGGREQAAMVGEAVMEKTAGSQQDVQSLAADAKVQAEKAGGSLMERSVALGKDVTSLAGNAKVLAEQAGSAVIERTAGTRQDIQNLAADAKVQAVKASQAVLERTGGLGGDVQSLAASAKAGAEQAGNAVMERTEGSRGDISNLATDAKVQVGNASQAVMEGAKELVGNDNGNE